MIALAKNNTEVWKYLATGSMSALLTMGVFMYKESREAKGMSIEELRTQMPGLVMQNNPYTQDAKDISSRLASIDQSVTALHTTLTIIQDRQQQQASDIALIAATAHVTAHPVRTETKP